MPTVSIPKGYFPMYVGLNEVPNFHMARRKEPMVTIKIVPFQARFTFFQLNDKRVLFKDAFGMTWSVFVSSFPKIIPLLERGSLEGMWKMYKKGAAFGLVWLGQEHMADVLPDTRNFPLLLNTIPWDFLNHNLDAWYISPELAAVAAMTDFS